MVQSMGCKELAMTWGLNSKFSLSGAQSGRCSAHHFGYRIVLNSLNSPQTQILISFPFYKMFHQNLCLGLWEPDLKTSMRYCFHPDSEKLLEFKDLNEECHLPHQHQGFSPCSPHLTCTLRGFRMEKSRILALDS